MKIDKKTYLDFLCRLLSIFVFQNSGMGINEIETQLNETKRKTVKRNAINTKRNEIDNKLEQM